MPDLEWIALGAEPGCRQAAMDPQIKLFGQTISVIPSHTGAGADAGVLRPTSASPPWDAAPTSSQDGGDSALLGTENKGAREKLLSARSSSRDEFLQLFKASALLATECGAPNAGALQLCDDNNSEGAPSDELKDIQGLDGDHHSSHSAGDGGKNHFQKPPDKVVACPRCNSQDTKFCYYNNYNVNQPRHFCKHCQRYWTAGGTLRNVPVGAGRRKNKSSGGGGLQHRDNNCAEASPNCAFQIDSGELFSCGPLAPPKRLAPGQGSPLRSSGSAATTTSFGQESGITISSPPYSLYQNGRLPFQSFNSCTQAFTTSGADATREASAVGSSDSASTLRGQRLVQFPSGNHPLDNKDCSRSSSLSGQLQDAASLGAMRTAAFHAYRSDNTSGWAGNGREPVRFFNGEWPHGYNLDWDGKHPRVPVLTTQSTATTTTALNPTPSWSPALAPWASNVSHASNARATGWTVTTQSSLGKRRGVSDESPAAVKLLRTGIECRRSAWPMLQARTTTTSSTEVHTTSVDTLKQLFHLKREPSSAACEPNDTFMRRLLSNAAAPRPAPFPVTT